MNFWGTVPFVCIIKAMDFSREYKKLLLETPKQALTQWNCENSDYTVFVNHSKNSYMCCGSGWMRDCYYLYWVYHAEDAADCSYCEKAEFCYESVDLYRCYNCDFCQDCKDSHDLILCYDCTGCKNCFGCVGLIRKEFYAFNQQKTREEYAAILKKFQEEYKRTGEIPAQIAGAFEKAKSGVPHRDFIFKCEDCVGSHIENSQRCFYCFDMVRSRDCNYNYNAYENVDSVDCSFTKAELGYENLGGGWNFNCDFVLFLMNCADCKFCFQCQDCKNCFGCDALHHKQYYILNKPCPKEEYEKRVKEIWMELKASERVGDLMSVFEDEEFLGVDH